MKRTVFCTMCFIAAAEIFAQVKVNEIKDVAPGTQVTVIDVPLISTEFVELGKKNPVFSIGEGVSSVTAKRKIFPYKINKFETTYSLWYVVRTWAESNGYVFGNPGQEGSSGLRGKLPTEANAYQPVTNINWYDAVVWCNAYSEMQGFKPCYTYKKSVLKDSTNTYACDLCVCDFESNGYRLPTEAEWEYAARYSSKGLQDAAVPSGQINDSLTEEDVAWISTNSSGTHIVGTAGTPFAEDSLPEPASGVCNGAGLYDMSGNVLEFCWDWMGDYKEISSGKRYAGPSVGSERVMRGGSWNEYTMFASCGDRYSFDPNEAYNYMGFRIVQSVK